MEYPNNGLHISNVSLINNFLNDTNPDNYFTYKIYFTLLFSYYLLVDMEA